MTGIWRRFAGALLFAYGISGLALVIGGGLLVANSVASLDGLSASLEQQRLVLVRSLDATATFLSDARTGTGNVQTSLVTSVETAHQTAELTRGLATAMNQLAEASTVSILGNQPFGALTATFARVGGQSTALAGSLDLTADALARNGTDLIVILDYLGRIQAEIDDLRRQLSGSGDAGTLDLSAATRALETSRLVLFGLLAWLALQAVAAAAVGLVLVVRPGRPRWPEETP
jgi:hypothetical protein